MDAALAISQISTQAEGKRFGVRAGAYMLDMIVMWIISLAVTVAAAFPIGIAIEIVKVFWGLEYTIGEQPDQFVNYFGNLVVYTLYFTLFEWLYGATPGKLVLGMRVVKEDGGRCSLLAAFWRALLRFVDALLFCAVAYVNMKAPLYQRLGDKHAKTLVVSSNNAIIQRPRGGAWFVLAAISYLVVDLVYCAWVIVTMVH